MVSIPTRDSTVFQIIEEGWNISHEPGVGIVALRQVAPRSLRSFLSNAVTRVVGLGDEYPNDPLRSRNNSNNPANAEDICLQRFHGMWLHSLSYRQRRNLETVEPAVRLGIL